MVQLRSFFIWIAIIGVASLLLSCGSRDHVRSARDANRYISEHNLRNLPKSDIPLVINERVVAWMEYFQGPGRRHFERYLGRSGRYIPLMQKILKEEGMPKDLVYIALIESGFNDSARSHASAVGNWQFISSTGRIYGLDINTWVDERRDPYLATVAAARFFRDLHDEFGDWYLAMAGYNAGPGRVRNAIASTGSRDFWDHADDRHALRAETRDYVPKYIAATIMAKDPTRFGFKDIDYEEPLEFDTAKVETQTDISVIAKCAGAPEEEIQRLNAHLVRGATPPDRRNYSIRLPRGTSEKFTVAYARIPEDERISIVRHEVRKGETLVKIARRYGVSTRQLASANGISRKAKLRRGETLIIPVGSYAARVASYDNDESGGGKRSTKVIKYRVKKGDTLGGIASRYRGVSVAKLRSWNGLGGKSHIRVGQVLKIYGKGAPQGGSGSSGGTYTVKRGETVGAIAARNGVKTADLLAWNGMSNARELKAGQRLKLAPPEEKAAAAESTAGSSQPSDETRKSRSTHTVKRGETVGAIAARYGMGTKELMALNGIKDPRKVRAGQKLKVTKEEKAQAQPAPAEVSAPLTAAVEPHQAAGPSASAVETKAAPAVEKPSAKGGAYELKPGETIGHVAERYGVSTKDIMAWNRIKDPRRVRAGQKLVIKGGAKTAAPSPQPTAIEPKEAPAGTPIKLSDASAPRALASEPRTVNHTVKSGESLWSIARRHNVTIAELQKWNNLSDPSAVKVGSTLKVIKN